MILYSHMLPHPRQWEPSVLEIFIATFSTDDNMIQQYADLLALRKQYLDMWTYVHIIIAEGFQGSWRGDWRERSIFNGLNLLLWHFPCLFDISFLCGQLLCGWCLLLRFSQLLAFWNRNLLRCQSLQMYNSLLREKVQKMISSRIAAIYNGKDERVADLESHRKYFFNK